MDDDESALAPKFLTTSTDLSVLEGSQVRVNCRVNGRPAPEVRWFKDGREIASGARHRIVVNETGFHTLMVLDARMEDAGGIECVARNRSGEARFKVELRDEIHF